MATFLYHIAEFIPYITIAVGLILILLWFVSYVSPNAYDLNKFLQLWGGPAVLITGCCMIGMGVGELHEVLLLEKKEIEIEKEKQKTNLLNSSFGYNPIKPQNTGFYSAPQQLQAQQLQAQQLQAQQLQAQQLQAQSNPFS